MHWQGLATSDERDAFGILGVVVKLEGGQGAADSEEEPSYGPRMPKLFA